MWSALATAKDVLLQGGDNRTSDATIELHIDIASPYNFIT